MKMLCSSPSVPQLNPELLADITQSLNADGSRLLILAKPLAQRDRVLSYGIQPRTKTPIEKNQLWQQLLHPQAPVTIQHGAAVYPIDSILEQLPLTPLFTAFRTAGIESLLILALGDRDRCVGCLTLFRSTAKITRELRWTDEELQLAQNFGMQLYLAVMEQRVDRMFRDRLYRDLLTGLPNRLLLNQLLTLTLAKMPGESEVLVVILLNLDRFKHINDRLGHRSGDRLLQLTAERLQNTFGSEATIGRWSGDEFALIIPTLDRISAVNQAADRLLNCFDLPFNFALRDRLSKPQSLQLTASIGIAIATTSRDDSEVLLQQADTALHRAKHYGTSCEIYQEIDPPAIARLQLEHILDRVCAAIADRSIEDRDLSLHYQPQIDIQTGEIIGVEALLRCQDLQAKFINPNELIPIAEETGSIIQIGAWVIRTACNQNKIWQDRGWSSFPIAVNFSVKQLQDRHSIETILSILAETGLSPTALEIEITESIAIKDLDRTIAILESLRNIGVKISLDDFGTGYSSLAALKYLPLDRLKIDRAFIRELRANTVDAGIVSTIVNLGHELQLDVIAEGVETIEQLEFLRSINCDAAQGFLFSRPMAALDLESAIANGSYWHPDLFESDRELKL
jgi:diguanylate cyclase (GGDEF)-like protein